MNLLLLPDFIAMTLLVVVLLLVRGKRNDGVIGLWTAGLLLILLECASRIVYGMHTSHAVHLLSHTVALNAYGIAGALFLMSASQVLRRMPGGTLFLWSNVAPHLLLLTAYGLDVRQAWVYQSIAALGFLTGVVSTAWFRRSSPFYAAFALIWTPLLVSVLHRDYRTTTYLSLFFLFGLSALFFFQSLPRGSRGKIAVVAGFTMWALCFATHPWVAAFHPQWAEFVSQLWNMQKFVITVGLLLVMLEDQIRSNEWLALHDGLTGLPNRRLFEDRLQQALMQAQRTGGRLALFNLDLDGFKQVNDTLGHDAGDVLLKGISANLSMALRRTDTLARLGGDEFALIAEELDGLGATRQTAVAANEVHGGALRLPQVQRILAALMQGVETPVQLGESYDGRLVQISASVGIAIYPDDAAEGPALIRLADQRMYAQKAKGAGAEKKASNYSDQDLQRA
ncbi:MAG: diguanylate cyclase domain-containing protein [Janthinobacterium lividum]